MDKEGFRSLRDSHTISAVLTPSREGREYIFMCSLPSTSFDDGDVKETKGYLSQNHRFPSPSYPWRTQRRSRAYQFYQEVLVWPSQGSNSQLTDPRDSTCLPLLLSHRPRKATDISFGHDITGTGFEPILPGLAASASTNWGYNHMSNCLATAKTE